MWLYGESCKGSLAGLASAKTQNMTRPQVTANSCYNSCSVNITNHELPLGNLGSRPMGNNSGGTASQPTHLCATCVQGTTLELQLTLKHATRLTGGHR